MDAELFRGTGTWTWFQIISRGSRVDWSGVWDRGSRLGWGVELELGMVLGFVGRAWNCGQCFGWSQRLRSHFKPLHQSSTWTINSFPEPTINPAGPAVQKHMRLAVLIPKSIISTVPWCQAHTSRSLECGFNLFAIFQPCLEVTYHLYIHRRSYAGPRWPDTILQWLSDRYREMEDYGWGGKRRELDLCGRCYGSERSEWRQSGK